MQNRPDSSVMENSVGMYKKGFSIVVDSRPERYDEAIYRSLLI